MAVAKAQEVFEVFSCEALGGITSASADILRRMAHRISFYTGQCPRKGFRYLLQAVAVTIVRGSAAMITAQLWE